MTTRHEQRVEAARRFLDEERRKDNLLDAWIYRITLIALVCIVAIAIVQGVTK